ncbi:RING finger protein 11 [Athene cunicularia]|uniref:RING finger protein 11 n=1 Tax=Athene cunicularia TaxID=194338 RepID=UPI000EF70A35|nr:RING finger protein 11 [Athene cunicularia]
MADLEEICESEVSAERCTRPSLERAKRQRGNEETEHAVFLLLEVPELPTALHALQGHTRFGRWSLCHGERKPPSFLHGSSEQVPVPVYHPTPSQTRLATQLTEEEQIRIAQRIGLIQHLPKGVYDPGRDGSEKKIRECVICMMDFVYGDPIRFLPCMHIYHLDCIDDWLMRSFTCPSCMEPVDAALLSSYETN